MNCCQNRRISPRGCPVPGCPNMVGPAREPVATLTTSVEARVAGPTASNADPAPCAGWRSH
eukprot:4057465-Lingulodinium_polyedra.AAC.1